LDKTALLVESTDAIVNAKSAIEVGLKLRQKRLEESRAELALVDQELSVQTSALAQQAANVSSVERAMSEATQALEFAKSLVAQEELSIQKCYETCNSAMQLVLEDRQREFVVVPFRSLSPEQLGWSVLQATKVLENYVATDLAAIDKESPLPADATQELLRARHTKATRQALDKLRGNVDVFSNLYASGVGQSSDEFFASPDQALFMSNGGSVFAWSVASGTNVTGLVAQQSDTMEAARVMVRSLLSREPTLQEQQWIAEQLTKATDKKSQIAQELVWGMLTSSEFRVYP
ncbi:MAG: hypothetical protein ABL921_15895, partial [Pirellula sp.]